MFLYDAYQEGCHKLIENIKAAKTAADIANACYELADYKVTYYSQFIDLHPECSKLGKFYEDQLRVALLERADAVDMKYDAGLISES